MQQATLSTSDSHAIYKLLFNFSDYDMVQNVLKEETLFSNRQQSLSTIVQGSSTGNENAIFCIHGFKNIGIDIKVLYKLIELTKRQTKSDISCFFGIIYLERLLNALKTSNFDSSVLQYRNKAGELQKNCVNFFLVVCTFIASKYYDDHYIFLSSLVSEFGIDKEQLKQTEAQILILLQFKLSVSSWKVSQLTRRFKGTIAKLIRGQQSTQVTST
jgi:hypothetical protein